MLISQHSTSRQVVVPTAASLVLAILAMRSLYVNKRRTPTPHQSMLLGKVVQP